MIHHPAGRTAAFLIVIAALATGCVPGPTYTVDSTADAVDATPGDGVCAASGGACTLRAAIQEANATPGGNNILVPQGTYTLTIPEPGNGGITGGDLDVTDSLRVRPAGSGKPIVRAGGEFRVFDLENAFIRFDSLVIQDGDDIEGGGVRVADTALFWGFFLEIVDNSGFNDGGGIINRGEMVLFDSELRGNFVAARGGAIRASSMAVTTLWYTTVSGNAANVGAGMHSQGTASVFNTTVSGNDALAGGAGGLFNSGTMTLANATVAFNRAQVNGRPAGVWNFDDGSMTVRNTIIAQNRNIGSGPDDCQGTLFSQGYNLIEDPSGCTFSGTTTGHITGQDPLLGTLQVNGAGTPTHALSLSPGSPALAAGNPAPVGGPPPACWGDDQRHQTRGQCAIGAYEPPGG